MLYERVHYTNRPLDFDKEEYNDNDRYCSNHNKDVKVLLWISNYIDDSLLRCRWCLEVNSQVSKVIIIIEQEPYLTIRNMPLRILHKIHQRSQIRWRIDRELLEIYLIVDFSIWLSIKLR